MIFDIIYDWYSSESYYPDQWFENKSINFCSSLDDPVVEASKTIDGKPISYPTLQQAVYSLTAFLNVRDFFFRFSEDLCVSELVRYDSAIL